MHNAGTSKVAGQVRHNRGAVTQNRSHLLFALISARSYCPLHARNGAAALECLDGLTEMHITYMFWPCVTCRAPSDVGLKLLLSYQRRGIVVFVACLRPLSAKVELCVD
jgi:hypothetical protein